jgi:hypothetical protein
MELSNSEDMPPLCERALNISHDIITSILEGRIYEPPPEWNIKKGHIK